MARKAREKSATGVYAVVLRTNDDIFKDTSMREIFAGTSENYLGAGLMGLRFLNTAAHMLVRESEKGISMDMKPLVTSFARACNKSRGINGKVFADRFRSIPVEDAELERACTEYLNGGKTAWPYAGGATRTDTVKAPAKKKSAPKKTLQKAEAEPEKKPVRKKQQLPSWLL